MYNAINECHHIGGSLYLRVTLLNTEIIAQNPFHDILSCKKSVLILVPRIATRRCPLAAYLPPAPCSAASNVADAGENGGQTDGHPTVT